MRGSIERIPPNSCGTSGGRPILSRHKQTATSTAKQWRSSSRDNTTLLTATPVMLHEIAGQQTCKGFRRNINDTQAAYLLLRYSLNARFSFLMHAVEPAALQLPRADGSVPVCVHDEMLHRSLCYLLVDPTVSQERRTEMARSGSYVMRIFKQGSLGP